MVDGSAVLRNPRAHVSAVCLEHFHDLFRLDGFREGGESSEVAEKCGDATAKPFLDTQESEVIAGVP